VKISVLIPWRPDGEHRQALFDYVSKEWTRFPVEVSIGLDDPTGPFNRARALNRAAEQATGDLFAIFDADTPPPVDVFDRFERLDAWGYLFTGLEVLRADATTVALRRQRSPYDDALPLYGGSPFALGVIGVKRDVFEASGGYDERFHGWGMEDLAFAKALKAVAEPTAPLDGNLRSFWHEPASHLYVPHNRNLFLRDYDDPEALPATLASLRAARLTRKAA
jgi:hypothetical protein